MILVLIAGGKCYYETKLMQFLIKNDRLIKCFNEIWNEISKM